VNASELKTVAASLEDAGAPGVPTVVLVREVPLFEVEFEALEFAEEAELPSSDWAALALGHALGEFSPADVDAYLGLGEAVSEGLVRRLLDEELLEERADESSLATRSVEDSGIGGFFRRLLGGAKAPPGEATVSPGRMRTTARRLRESRASSTPVCRLGTGGAQALERGAVAQRRVRPARLLFLAEPLLFLGVVDEKRQRHTQHRRPHPLEPEHIPDPFHVLDLTFALPPIERLGACGIETSIGGFPGQFVGIVPGAQWEVRQMERRSNEGRGVQMALLVFAAFPSSGGGDINWHAYLRQQDQTQDCPHIDAARFLHADLRSLSSLLNVIESDGELPTRESLRGDGAFDIRGDESLLPSLLGEADRPDDTFLSALAPGWWVGIRAHALPADVHAARTAFFAFLRRRDANLRRAFDATCAEVAVNLISYWSEDPGLPSADEVAVTLWARAELRAALCMRRCHRDLVAPYESTEPAR
jgi:hypothetical protein